MWFWGNVLLCSAITVGSVVAHELGHVLAALLARLKVVEVAIGHGRELLSWRLSRVRMTLRMVPLSGSVGVDAPLGAVGRGRALAFAAGGPLANLLLAGVAVWMIVQRGLPLDLTRPAPWLMLLAANLIVLAYSLWPAEEPVEGVALPSDGLSMLRQLSPAPAARKRRERTDPLDPNPHWRDGLEHLAAGRLEEARQAMWQALGRVYDDRAGQGIIMAELARAGLMMGGATLKEAALAAEEATARLPGDPVAMTVKGAVLAGVGDLESGMALLRRALPLHTEAGQRVLCLFYLASAHLRQGEGAEAKRCLAAARQIDPLADTDDWMAREVDRAA